MAGENSGAGHDVREARAAIGLQGVTWLVVVNGAAATAVLALADRAVGQGSPSRAASSAIDLFMRGLACYSFAVLAGVLCHPLCYLTSLVHQYDDSSIPPEPKTWSRRMRTIETLSWSCQALAGVLFATGSVYVAAHFTGIAPQWWPSEVSAPLWVLGMQAAIGALATEVARRISADPAVGREKQKGVGSAVPGDRELSDLGDRTPCDGKDVVVRPVAAVWPPERDVFFLWACDFLDAALTLSSSGDKRSAVPDYLAGHSLELFLKAFLLTKPEWSSRRPADLKDPTVTSIRKLGHRLASALTAARAAGLDSLVPVTVRDVQEIAKADARDYSGEGIRYVDIDALIESLKGAQLPPMPDLNTLLDFAERLRAGLKDHCHEAASQP